MAPPRIPVNSRVILTAGFGGLLLLMTFSAIDGMQALQQIQTSNDTIREQFLQRTRVLERIRSDVYVSGTYVRDYLLEPESGKAEGHRYSLLEARRDMDSALAEYRTLIDDRAAGPFQGLIRQLADSWSVLEPVFEWSPEHRRRAGYVFLRDEVFPRRQSMLAIANQIGALNEAQLNAGRVKVEETFRQDIHDGIEFLSNLAFQVADGDFDKSFGPQVKCVVYTEDGTKRVQPAKGFKGHKDLL